MAFSGKVEELEAIDVNTIMSEIEYIGFNRDTIITKLIELKASPRTVSTIAAIGALRGSNYNKLDHSRINAETGKFIKDNCNLGTNLKGKDPSMLSILRITTALPNYAALFLLRSNASAKMPLHKCPPCIQFPAAASLPMSDDIRTLHRDFCIEFSKRLPNGSFNDGIYEAMVSKPVPLEEVHSDLAPHLGIVKSVTSVRGPRTIRKLEGVQEEKQVTK
jgi:hypothetical protein